MDSPKARENSAHRMTVAANLRVAVPCILVGGTLGAIVGSALESAVIGIRVGIILGGVIAFTIVRRRKSRAS